jgi:hypothetical protein
MWPSDNADDAFRESVRDQFTALASDCGGQLEQIDPLIFGFRSPCAVLTIGAYPGHYRGVCVKLRSSVTDEPVSLNDRADIGLANIEVFVTGKKSEVYNVRKKWAPDELKLEVQALAAKVKEVALPYLLSRDADWNGVREMIGANFKKTLEEKPWLKKYSRNA